jgi:hypothetical protein
MLHGLYHQVREANAAPMTEKANSDERVTVNEEVNNRNDIQGSGENRSSKQ